MNEVNQLTKLARRLTKLGGVGKLPLLLLILSLATATLHAQSTITVRGTVIDTDGFEVIGATVFVLGQEGMGATTNLDGQFTINNVPSNATLRISFVGMKTQDIPLNGRTELNVTLEPDSELLDEVVVTALGIERSEKALAYNVQELKGDDLTKVKDANFMNSLVGKVAGVNINASSSGIGGATRVVMRGPKSLSSSNQALYVVDGVPMFNINNGDIAGGKFSTQPGGEGISDINPDDIQSISVLSGASAAALYGSAAANGVIMVTTKKGAEGRVRLTISNNTSFLTATMLPKFQNSYINEKGQIASWGKKVADENEILCPQGFFQTGTNIQNSVALNVGSSTSQTYLSIGTTNATGIMPNSGYDRYNLTARNTTSFLDDLFSLDLSLNYIKSGDKNLMAQGQYYNPLPALYLFPRGENFDSIRTYEIYDPVRKIYTQNWPYGDALSMQNPYWILYRMPRTNNKDRYMLAGTLSYNPLEWLTITARGRYDYSHNKSEDKRYASTASIFTHSDYGYYGFNNSFAKAIYGDLMATVNQHWGDFSLSAVLGASGNYNSTHNDGFKGGLKAPSNIFTPNAIDYTRGGKPFSPNFGGYEHLIYSLFGSAEIGYKSALYLSVTGRNDWDSALAGTTHESFFYPSVGLSTILSEFIPMPKEYISFLKLRGSWASVGSAIPVNLSSEVKYNYNPGTQSYTLDTYRFPKTFYPERTNSWEVGLTANLFDGLWDLDLTWYQSNTMNQTFLRTISASEGSNNEYIQAGNVRNRGIELSTSLNFEWGDFTWTPTYTFSMNKNKIMELLPDESEIIKKGGLDGIEVILKKGGSMGDVYDYSSLQYTEEGYLLVEGGVLGTKNLDNPIYRGSTLPLANMGLSNNFTWKGLNFGFLLSARLGGIVMSQTQAILDSYGVSQASANLREAGGVPVNLSRIGAKEYLTAVGGEKPLWENYIYDGTNVRLQQAYIGYTLRTPWLREDSSISLGLTGNNLLMIYVKAPFDPELTASTGTYFQGFDYFMQPANRSLGFNIRINL